MTAINARKVVTLYAEVSYNGWEYKVTPSGTVLVWAVGDSHEDGYWTWMSNCDTGYDEIKQAGLAVLQEEKE
jgi:hypothetical protein